MNFAEKIKQPSLGTFVKTPHPHVVEVLALSGLDFIVLDAEHAPFDRGSLDLCIMAARLAGLPTLVRVQDSSESALLNALDCGATGVQVPHVCSAEQAEKLVKKCHYGAYGRGYAGSTRAAAYATKPMAEHLADSAVRTTLVAQIEDPSGVGQADAIASVDGVDALFIGQVDLCVAYGAQSVNDAVVKEASLAIIEAGKRWDKPVGMFLASSESAGFWLDQGASFFAVGSEHKMIVDGFKREQKAFLS